jgi:hypothetical protein
VNNVGGLIGYQNGGSTSYSYTTGNVTNTGSASTRGGIIGNMLGGTVSNSYWDTQTTGVVWSSGSDLSFGKTTAQMTTQSTFTGWNFVSDWFIHPSYNSGYPQLAWTGAPPALNIPTNVVIEIGTISGTVSIAWDDMQASWYGIYSGSTPAGMTYQGWTTNNNLTITAGSGALFKVTSGNGTAPGTQLPTR